MAQIKFSGNLGKKYCKSLTRYERRQSEVVKIGDLPLGGNHPIRIQSMTTVDTMDTEGTVQQSIRMIEAGCEYVRVTAPSMNEAANLENIKKELRLRGYDTPLIADIHFTPNAAELAARIVEKVRVNPGNYADKKKFENIRYTRDTYNAELDRIREKFSPLVKICKEYGTAMRIGTNHGSLSDRIMSRYGDTPMGMVESALEFVRICEDLNYYDIVLSMKASNPKVMIQAYRLLVNRLDAENLKPYPLHLGVTEAGEAEDGRIKSAVGIGTLLEDGLGDTIRVSLTEEPEAEIPVARRLVSRYKNRQDHKEIPEVINYPVDPFEYTKRVSDEVSDIGGTNVPRVIADYSNKTIKEYSDLRPIGHVYLPEPDKFVRKDISADYIYSGKSPSSVELPPGLREIVDYKFWRDLDNKENMYPLFDKDTFIKSEEIHPELNFICLGTGDLDPEILDLIGKKENFILIVQSDNTHKLADIRRLFVELINNEINNPVIIKGEYPSDDVDEFRLFSATDLGGLLTDGLGDGLMLTSSTNSPGESKEINSIMQFCNETAFGILQATRTRITKTEYISCPSCGRTLFDLQETTAMIRKRTDHLKGVKIGIMGCIVNGPGEMADADYGYVGSGKGKITLYKGKEVVKRGVPSEDAVDELINLIRQDGNWIEMPSDN
ncbi:MAG: (E)-4-hydroxy-3-methylbut-2-enyl-diphosphate synthase [Cyclobacteriaceae bacterium]|jgi:(E)-4-hydroxy-3-methylbut-2-enyl-diphosphate synthase